MTPMDSQPETAGKVGQGFGSSSPKSEDTHRAEDGAVVADHASLLPCPFCKTRMRMGYDPKTEMYGPEGQHLPGCIIGNWDLREYSYRPDANAAWNARGGAEPSSNTCQFDAGQSVSNPYKFDAEIAWLQEAARYFAKRPAGGEDNAHWANVYNAENANNLADRLAALNRTRNVAALSEANAPSKATGADHG